MQSLFLSINQVEQGPYEFWTPFNNEEIKEVFRGKLSEAKKPGFLIENTYILSDKALIRLEAGSKKPVSTVNIQWKLIEPFVEEKDDTSRYGFSLGHQNASEDFYVKNKEELDLWLEKLSYVGILTDLEDDYQLEMVIGRGAYSKVFLAKHRKDCKKFAIKSIDKREIKGNQENYEALIKEIKIMRKLNHPNIIKLHKIYEDEDNVHLVLDYAKGEDLYTRVLMKDNFIEKDVAKMGQKLLCVLDYLNSQNIVHRDIKLENILMDSYENDYDFKLADFGLATEATGDLKLRCGTPGYIAPEILRRQPYGTKSDLFSVGIIMYILLSGKMPFYSESVKDILVKNTECIINFNDHAWKYVSKDAVNLIKSLTDPNPENRILPEEAVGHKWFCKKLKSMSFRSRSLKSRSQEINRERGYLEVECIKIKTRILPNNFVPIKKARLQRLIRGKVY